MNSPDVLILIRTLITESWRFFTQWSWPGSSMTPAAIIFALASASLAARLFEHYFQGGGGPGAGGSPRGGGGRAGGK